MLNMGVMSGMRHWISISNGFLDIESAHIFVDRVKTCVFWHTLVLGLVICGQAVHYSFTTYYLCCYFTNCSDLSLRNLYC